MAKPQSNLDVNINGNDNLSPALDRLNNNISRWSSGVIRYVGAVSAAMAAIETISFPVRAVREFEREMANVQKTTNFTDLEIRGLSRSLIEMSTKIDLSATELAKLAASAGQMGLGREGVAGITAFTDSVSRMASTLDISVEDAGASIGKLSSIFKVPLVEIERMISGFNEVANNSTAAGDQLIDVVRRVGDAAGTFKSYADAIGIGAAAIDFGVSPEVAGTSITKIFADMQSKAEKFGEIMKMSATGWIEIVQDDGIGAFKLYIDKLRDMDSESRQKAIRELSGTGRIGALLNKFVNDTTNSVLDRALGNAYKGMREGTSALKEQETVLKSLDAQIKMASNSFRALGILAGEQFSDQLGGYMAQLTQALQSEGVREFAESVGRAFLSVIDIVATVVKTLAGLNVNWENLITLATVLGSIKLAQMIGGWVLNFDLLRRSMERTALTAKTTQDAISGAFTPPTVSAGTGMLARSAQDIEQFKALIQQRKLYRDAILAQAQAENQLRAAEVARTAALKNQDAAFAARSAAVAAERGLGTATPTAAAAGVAASRAALAAVESKYQSAKESRERAHQTRLTTLQANYERQRAAAQSANSASSLSKLDAAYAKRVASEERAYARSLRDLDSYHARKLAKEQANAAAIAATASAGTAAATGAAAAAAAAATAKANTALRVAGGQVARTTIELEKAQGSFSIASKAADAARSAFSSLGSAVLLLRTGFSLLLRVVSGVAIWATIAYSIADMLGWLDKVPGAWQKFTDAVGLSSEAQRKAAVDDQQRTRKLKEQREEVDALVKSYDDLRDARTGKLGEDNVKALPTLLSGSNVEAQKDALDYLLTNISAVQAKIKRDSESLEILPLKREQTQAKLSEMEKAYAATVQRMKDIGATLTDAQLSRVNNGDVGSRVRDRPLREYAQARKDVEDLGKELEAFRKESVRTGQDVADGLTKGIQSGKEELERLVPIVAGLFTDQSSGIFQLFAPALVQATERTNEYKKTIGELRQEIKRLGTDEAANASAIEEARQKQTAAFAALESENARITEIWSQINKEIDTASKAPGISPALLNSLQYLKTLLQGSPEALTALTESIRAAARGGVALTGANAPKPPREDKGDEKFGGGGESLARRLSKARLALAKAEAEAEEKLSKQANAERLRELEYTNDLGMISLQDFYEAKQRIQLDDLAKSIEIAQRERAAVQDTMKDAKDAAAKVQVEASLARVDGEIAALEAQKEYVVNTISRELQSARREFRQEVTAMALDLASTLGQTSDFAVFDAAYAQQMRGFETLINRLTEEAKTMPELLPAIDQIQMVAALRAVGESIAYIGDELDITTGALERYSSKLEIANRMGLMTTSQLEAAQDGVRESQLSLMRASVARMDMELSRVPAGTREYERQAAAIDDLRIRMGELAAETSATARGINQGLTSSLQELITSTTMELDSFKDHLLNFFRDIATQVTDVFSKNIAESFIKTISGTDGSGGLGGLVQMISRGFQGNTPVPQGVGANIAPVNDKPINALAQAGAQRGSSPLNPLFVSDVAGAVGGAAGGAAALGGTLGKFLGGDGSGVMENVLKEKVSLAGEALGSVTESITDNLLEAGTGVTDSIMDNFGELFGKLGGGLKDIFSQLFSGLGGAGGLGGILAGIFHEGGRVGSGSATRRVPMGMFDNAVKYHQGTRGAGLKPNEVPAILEEGETVRTTAQEKALQSALANSGAGGGTKEPLNFYVVTPDQAPVPSAKDIVITVADDISRGGILKKLIHSR